MSQIYDPISPVANDWETTRDALDFKTNAVTNGTINLGLNAVSPWG